MIRTDHAAFQWLRRTPDPVGQQARWLVQLAPYEFDIVHRPGVRHANADGVSRIPCRQCGRTDDEDNPELVASVTLEGDDDWSPETLVVKQNENPEIAEFRELLLQFTDRKPYWSEPDDCSEFAKILWTMWTEFVIKDGVLYRETTNVDTQEKEVRLVVPSVMRTALIRMVHDGLTGGHAGIAKTKDQVRRRAYWPGGRSQSNCMCCPASRVLAIGIVKHRDKVVFGP